jgi:hypothetical protein
LIEELDTPLEITYPRLQFLSSIFLYLKEKLKNYELTKWQKSTKI